MLKNYLRSFSTLIKRPLLCLSTSTFSLKTNLTTQTAIHIRMKSSKSTLKEQEFEDVEVQSGKKELSIGEMFDADFLEDNFLRAETSEHDLLMEDFNEFYKKAVSAVEDRNSDLTRRVEYIITKCGGKRPTIINQDEEMKPSLEEQIVERYFREHMSNDTLFKKDEQM